MSTFTPASRTTKLTTRKDETQYLNTKMTEHGLSRRFDFEKNNHTDTTGELTKVVNYNNPLMSCVRPQVFNTFNFYVESQSFSMIKFCFSGSKIVERCDDLHTNTDISEMLPITSNVTGLTYVNRFCFICNEGDAISETDFHVWDAVVVHYSRIYNRRVVVHPNELIDSITRTRPGYTNIHFLPRMGNTITRQCEAYDVISCNQTGLWETYSDNILKVCHEGHSLPIVHHVYHNNKRKLLRFKNIACVYCNTGHDFKRDKSFSCSYVSLPKIHSYSETLNLKIKDVNNTHTETLKMEHSPYNEEAVIAIPSSGVCPSSYIALLVSTTLLLLAATRQNPSSGFSIRSYKNPGL